MKENNVYKWQFKDEKKSYHCKSRIAIVKNNKLHDTFWNSTTTQIFKEDVILNFLFNLDDVVVGNQDDYKYYSKEDIYDISHSNDTSGGLYRKKNAEKDIDVMREYLECKLEEEDQNLKFKIRQIDNIKKNIETLTIDTYL